MTESTQQSTLVTVVAWIAILVSGLTAVMGWFQTVLISFFFPSTPMTSDQTAGATDVPPDFASGLLAMRVAAGVMMVAIVAVFAWLAMRLSSAQVRSEFRG